VGASRRKLRPCLAGGERPDIDTSAYSRPTYDELRARGRAADRSLPRRVVDFAWPFAALYLANRQQPVGDVPVQKSEEEWREQLSREAYYVLRKRGTERARSSPLDKQYSEGIYRCAGCGSSLFASAAKFDSGTGWPSFYEALPGSVDLTLQLLYCIGDFGAREVRCSTCGGHLGHVFSDGPPPTGKRYCMNGVALSFEGAGEDTGETA